MEPPSSTNLRSFHQLRQSKWNGTPLDVPTCVTVRGMADPKRRATQTDLSLKIRGRTTIPTETTHRDEDDREWQLVVSWEIADGRAEPVSIQVSASPPDAEHRFLSASRLRTLPLGTWIAEARTSNGDQWRAALADAGEVSLSQAASIDALWGPHRGRPASRTELQRVADAYSEARADGQSVTRAVAEACGVSESTAGKRIMQARRAGLLPKVEKR